MRWGTPFIEEMRAAAMRLHSRDQAMEPPIGHRQVAVLVDSKLVFETLEAIVDRAAVPWCQCTATLLLPACFFAVVK
jgi:heme oxygenase